MLFHNTLKASLFAILVLFSFYLMLIIILPYSGGAWNIDFLLTKQHIIHLRHYRWAFYLHIFTSLYVLLVGVIQFSAGFLRKWPRIHRRLGQAYVFIILCISGPAALVMSFYSNGDWNARLSFILLSIVWWWFTWRAYQTARRRDFESHGAFMTRSYALTLSAITLRLLQYGISSWWYLDPDLQYSIVAWASWGLNLAFAEYLIWRKKGLPRQQNFVESE
ncbi:MAG: DUF2306 domain-containing protein [Saprospiraceae bacterium]|nr:DUF2306 domain-containing protein [Saprospiraceae bacterium]